VHRAAHIIARNNVDHFCIVGRQTPIGTPCQLICCQFVTLFHILMELSDQICEAAGQHSQAFPRLETLCVEFGHRLAGSTTLNRAANWALELMKADGLDNVHLQPVPTEIWHRGKEWARLVTPREKPLSILGIGASVSTFDANPNVHADHACSTARARPTCSHADCAMAEKNAAATSGHDGILRASVAVVHEYEEFEAVAATGALKGKIVLFNAPFHSYDHSKDFRAHAASRAARAGAVAVLVRSIAPESLYTPHTGSMRYSVPQHIPAACIAIEDADFLETLIRRRQGTDEQVEIELYMEAHSAGTIVTHNVVGELRGTEKPEEIVLIGAHLDSWDVGQGAHDDGQGCMVAWETLRLCKQLNITTRRTLRCVLFADEEHRQSGARAYQLDNAAVGSDGLTKHVAAIGLCF
jgi:carboxypeptidase Q